MTATLLQLDVRPRVAPAAHPSDLIARLLQEQQELSAVEEFSAWHEHLAPSGLAEHYSRLIPATAPGPGQQLAFDVDLDRCSGCKACVVACHSLNGLDDDESFRDVGLLSGIGAAGPLMQHVTTACHHCLDPGCLNACPVNAYEKDPITGIVHHLDDQCFGCQYCTLACPYQVPKYHAAKGIVRKCDMCSQRLKVGEAPACVQACPHEAISIRIVDQAAMMSAAARGDFLPDSPDPAITIPATRFRGAAVDGRGLTAGTHATPVLQPAHWPLILLLVLSQISVGIASVVFGLRLMNAAPNGETLLMSMAAVLAIIAAISSTLHLGRPQFAYRAVLGIGHSWLSREIVAFGGFIPLITLSAALSYMGSSWLTVTLPAALVFGIAGVAASVMIYHVTQRPCWHARRTAVSFSSTALSLAPLLVAIVERATTDRDVTTLTWSLAVMALCGMLMKVFCGSVQSVSWGLWDLSSTSRSRGLQTNTWRLQRAVRARSGWLLTALMLTVVNLLAPAMLLAIGALVAITVAEFIDRYLFFRAAVPLRMPGVAAA